MKMADRILDLFYQRGLNSLAATEAEREKLQLAEAQAREWTGFPDPPPYSMLMLYGLQEEAEALRGKQAVLESSLAGWQDDSAISQTQAQAEVSRASGGQAVCRGRRTRRQPGGGCGCRLAAGFRAVARPRRRAQCLV